MHSIILMGMPVSKNDYQKEVPKIGEGIYLTRDVADILHLPYRDVYRLMKGFWHGHTFGEKGNKAINFYALIEFYIYFQFRSNQMPSQRIKKFHKQLSVDLKTKYPFAHYKISTDYRNIWAQTNENLLKADGSRQFDLLPLLDEFLHKVSYDDSNMAVKFYPLGKTGKIVVDPKKQFGQPVIEGTGIKTKTIYSLHKGGEIDKQISNLYDVPVDKIRNAIRFHTTAA